MTPHQVELIKTYMHTARDEHGTWISGRTLNERVGSSDRLAQLHMNVCKWLRHIRNNTVACRNLKAQANSFSDYNSQLQK